jgi:mono/diheme cytochrome c family protein
MHRFKSGFAAITLLALCAIAGQAQDLPDGPGKAEVESQCSSCHSLARVVSHRDSLEGWRVIVDNMVGMGAMFTDDDKELIVNYLFKSFSDKPAEAPAAAARPATPAGEPAAAKVDASKVDIKLGEGAAAVFITEACTQCHALSRLTAKGGRARTEWVDVVERMVKRGAALDDLKAAMVIDYLAAAYPK